MSDTNGPNENEINEPNGKSSHGFLKFLVIILIIGALIFSTIGYLYVRSRGQGRFVKRFIPVANTPPAALSDEQQTPEKEDDKT